jgi:microcystin-dependent protein
MGAPYIAELKLISWNFQPRGWVFCNGQTLPINQNQALFSLVGTMYGGNGQTNFMLPNLQGRVAMHFGAGYTQGQRAGEITHTLTQAEMPAHTHTVSGVNTSSNNASPGGHMLANTTGNLTFYGTSNPVAMFPGNVTNTGGSQPHENEQPYLVMNWIIALVGIFPSRN